MKVLFVSMVPLENNTSATIQNKGIIRGLSASGHTIDILTLKPNMSAIGHDSSMNDIKGIIGNSYYIDIDPRYAVIMAKKKMPQKMENYETRYYNENIVKNIVRITRNPIKKIYEKTAIFDAQKINVNRVSKLNIDYNQYDIIISASDPKSSHLIVKRILGKNKKCKAKWIQYWGDPMFIDITRERDWRNQIVKYHERKLISIADRIIYASPFTLDKQKEIYNKYSHKMDYASQAYAKVNSNVVERQRNTPLIVGYFGAYLSKIRDIIPLYKAAQSSDFKLNICGVSDINLDNKDNISVSGMLSYKEVVEMEEKSDILVCICNKEGTQIPGKIYYCTGYKKPIVVILDGDYKEEFRAYLESFNRFILCDNNEKAIKSAIVEAGYWLESNPYEISELLTPKYMASKILGRLNEI